MLGVGSTSAVSTGIENPPLAELLGNQGSYLGNPVHLLICQTVKYRPIIKYPLVQKSFGRNKIPADVRPIATPKAAMT